jgi:hypothetical protein
MDTSFWTALNPNILQLETIKAMHGQCLYRLAVLATGASILRSNQNIDDAITDRNNRRHYNWAGSWRSKPIKQEDAELLKLIRVQVNYNESSPRVNGTGIFKIRIEEPYIQFYSRHEKPLLELANELKFGDNSHFHSIMRPINKDNEQFLLDGYTLRKNKVEWPYRILIRDGRYSSESKTQIANYLTNLGTDIKVPNGLWDQLSKGGWIWGGYVYVRDKNIATVLGMMDPRLVSKIEEFKTVESSG